MSLFYILIGLIALFFILLGVKQIFKGIKKNFCVICLSISLTWIFLLILLILGLFDDRIILAILMGHTSLGIFYILDKKTESFSIFRLPFLLTSITAIYFVLSEFDFNVVILLSGLWSLFLIFYLFKNTKLKLFVDKIVECCKKW